MNAQDMIEVAELVAAFKLEIAKRDKVIADLQAKSQEK